MKIESDDNRILMLKSSSIVKPVPRRIQYYIPCMAFSTEELQGALKRAMQNDPRLGIPIRTAQSEIRDASEHCNEITTARAGSPQQTECVAGIKQEDHDSSTTHEKEPIEEMLDQILKSSRSAAKKEHKRMAAMKGPKTRQRKSKEQLELIEHEILSRGGKLDNQSIVEIANKIGLKKSQVYKWYWDYKNNKKNTVNK